jgi:hypothetical protein
MVGRMQDIRKIIRELELAGVWYTREGDKISSAGCSPGYGARVAAVPQERSD